MSGTKKSIARRLAAGLMLLAAAGLLRLLSVVAQRAFFAFYSPFSRAVSRALSFVFSFVRFSLCELMLYALLLLTLGGLIAALVRACRQRSPRFLLRYAASLFLGASALLFCYVLFWGLNYYAPPWENTLGLTVSARSDRALDKTADWLLDLVRQEVDAVPRGSEGQMDAGGFDALSGMMPDTYKALIAQSDLFSGGGTAPPKRVTLWRPLSYARISGIYVPFTGESNVNPDMIDAFLPDTMAHEMAHRLGFAREEDASYIAFRACMASPHAEVRYSGALCALQACLGAMPAEARQTFYSRMPEGVMDDLRYSNKRFEAQNYNESLLQAVSSFTESVNDGYLRTMGQTDGVRSYGRVVNLLIADYVSRYGDGGLS